MKRIIILISVVLLIAGCKSSLKVSNRSDPKDFTPVVLPGGGLTGKAFAELSFEVPEEVSNEEFLIARADIFADVYIDTLFTEGDVEIVVDFYLGLEPGPADLSDPAVNEFLATVTLTGQDQHNRIELLNPLFLRKGLEQGEFHVKIDADIITNPSSQSDPELGILRVDDIYFNAYLERETEGLFPIFYIF